MLLPGSFLYIVIVFVVIVIIIVVVVVVVIVVIAVAFVFVVIVALVVVVVVRVVVIVVIVVGAIALFQNTGDHFMFLLSCQRGCSFRAVVNNMVTLQVFSFHVMTHDPEVALEALEV